MSPTLGSVLMTSAARKVPLLRALRDAALRIDPEARVIAGDIDPEAPTRYLADDFWTMPKLDTLGLEALVAKCHARGIRTILPTRDGELGYWSAAQPALAEAGIAVIVSKPDAVARCLDKVAFAEWGRAEGLPVIPTATAPDVFGAGPLVVKERFGAGSRALGLGLSVEDARAHAARLTAPIFQPQVEGPEISVDAWMTATGAVHGLVLRRRDRVVGGESQITTTFQDPVLEGQSADVLACMGLSGPAVMQAIVTDAGLAVIEVNARFGGASTASLSVGLDMLYWSLFERTQPNAPLPLFERRAGEIRQVRVPQDIVIHDPDLRP